MLLTAEDTWEVAPQHSTQAKADLTFPSHIPGQAAQLKAHSTSKETLLWMCSLYHMLANLTKNTCKFCPE